MKAGLEKLINETSFMLQPQLKFASAKGVLYALSVVESSYGSNRHPRFEKSYAPLGNLYNGSQEQKDRFAIHGALACCSYSSFQIMHATACELGFDIAPWARSPMDLQSDEVAVFYVIEFIKNRIIAKGATKLEQIPDAYNTGNFKDSIFNPSYVKDFVTAYNSIQHNVDYSLA